MRSGVYVIECDGKQYVGSAQDIVARWGVHRHELRHNKHHSRYLQRAWNKHSEDAFTFRVLEHCEPTQCVEREQFWIESLKPVFNMHLVARSPLGVKRSAATRQKLRAIAPLRLPPMLGKNYTEATRNRLRGRIVSEETRAKLRTRAISQETRAKLSASKKGKVLSAEHRANISAALKGHRKVIGSPLK
jgi:group I intron endonuclease